MQTLLKRNDETFIVDTDIDFSNLLPIADFVRSKLATGEWDDYNELYHATRLIDRVKNEPTLWMEIHSIRKNGKPIGVLLIIGGEIQRLESKYDIENESRSLLLKYFHIVEKGKGYGSFWLTSLIFPHYREKGYHRIYVNSSHPTSFPFYERLGSVIARYEQPSDNNLFRREGRCFLIHL